MLNSPLITATVLAAMRNVVPSLKHAQYGDQLHSFSAVRDQMHVPGKGTVGIYWQIFWKTQPVDDTEPNKRAQMEAWLDKFFESIASNKDRVHKKATMDHWHALQNFRALNRDVSAFQNAGFKKDTEDRTQVYYGLIFKLPQETMVALCVRLQVALCRMTF